MNSLIGQYVNKLSINNINDFAIKNNIILSESELNVLLLVTKNHYRDILDGNDSEALAFVRANLSSENYDKVVSLYNEYKERYQGYL